MTILQGDIRFLKAQVQGDVPEGGGAPTANPIVDGVSNELFADISEVDRASGAVSLAKMFLDVKTNDTDTYLDANVIVAKPPADPNVSVTIFSPNELFDRRSDAQKRLEAYLIQSYGTPYFLLEDHVVGQRIVMFFARPGVAPPNVNRTLVLQWNFGLSTQREQYVRVIRVTAETRRFTFSDSGRPIDYDAQVFACELSDKLRYDFPGSPPTPLFAAAVGKTSTRDTIAADAGSYFSVQPLLTSVGVGAFTLTVPSVYTQLVPSARTESVALDQRPAAVRNVRLATSPRTVEIATSPHSDRLFIDQENRSFNYVNILKPAPAPGTVDVSYMALGNWYSIQDDGNGNLTGTGVGTINYLTGSISVTLPSLPDALTSLIYTWGETLAFTNRSGQAGFRRPEYSFQVLDGGVEPNSLSITWTSGGVVRTAVDNGSGLITGHAIGTIDYATGTILLQPNFMIDSGGEFAIGYDYSTKVTDSFANVTVDAAGIALLPLTSIPVAGTLGVRWVTNRTVSESSGGTLSGGSSNKASGSQTTVVMVPSVLAQQVADQVALDKLKNPASNRVPANGSNTTALAPGSNFTEMGLITRIGVYPTGIAAYGILQATTDPADPYAGYFYEIPDPNTPISLLWYAFDPMRAPDPVTSLPILKVGSK